METDKLSFLDETPEEEVVEEVKEPEAPEAEEAAPEPEQVEASDEGTGEEEAAPPVAEEQKPRDVPINVVLDEREKRQAAQREADEYKRRAEELDRQMKAMQAQQSQQKPPDWFQDPDARMKFERQQVEHQQWNQTLNTSEMIAASAHGVEVVEAAKQAFQAQMQRDPTLAQSLRQQRHPYDFVVKWHKQQEFLSKVGDNPDEYINQEVERLVQERIAQAQPSKPKAPPPSMSGTPTAGSKTPPSGSAFDAIFDG